MNNLRKHIVWLEKDGWYVNGNYPRFLPIRSFFSTSYSLKVGLSILLYTRTHLLKINAQMKLHRCNNVRGQIQPNINIITHEGVYYADAKTRKFPKSPYVEHNTHYHAYLYPTDNSNRRNTTNGFNGSVAREPGNRVYR